MRGSVVETDRYRVEGDVKLPREGYRSRISDYLNRREQEFLTLTNVELRSIDGLRQHTAGRRASRFSRPSQPAVPELHLVPPESARIVRGSGAAEMKYLSAPRPFDLFLNASGRACPAPTSRPCRGEACLALSRRVSPAAGEEITRLWYCVPTGRDGMGTGSGRPGAAGQARRESGRGSGQSRRNARPRPKPGETAQAPAKADEAAASPAPPAEEWLTGRSTSDIASAPTSWAARIPTAA